MRQKAFGPDQRNAFLGKSGQLIIAIVALFFNFSALAQTRDQLQPVNATGFRWYNGEFRQRLYVPLDTLSTLDSGAIAYKNGVFYVKNNTRWIGWGKAVKVNDSTIVVGPDTLILKGYNSDNTYWELDGDDNLTNKTFSGDRVIVNKHLQVSDSGFVAIGTANGTHPIPSTSGRLFFWHPGKAALRAGSWFSPIPDASIGNLSVAFGSASAMGAYSFAAGDGVSALGNQSVALGGASNNALGNNSLVAGAGSSALGNASISLGYGVVSEGQGALATGYFTAARNGAASAFGSASEALGRSSAAFGEISRALGRNSFTAGYITTTNTTDRIPQFSIGWGTDTSRGSELFRIGWRPDGINSINIFSVDTLGQTKVAHLQTGGADDGVVVWSSSDSLLKKIPRSEFANGGSSNDTTYTESPVYVKSGAKDTLAVRYDTTTITIRTSGVNDSALSVNLNNVASVLRLADTASALRNDFLSQVTYLQSPLSVKSGANDTIYLKYGYGLVGTSGDTTLIVDSLAFTSWGRLYKAIDSIGALITGSGTANTNAGSGYRILKPGTQQLKTLFPRWGNVIDSTTNTDGLTLGADSTAFATRAWRQKGLDSLSAVLRSVIADTAVAIRGDFPAGGGGGVSDGDKGDITVSGSGSTWTIDNTAVSFAKMQIIATNRLLGRSTAGSGSIEELQIGSNLALSSGTLDVGTNVALLGGRSGGQTLTGGTGNNDDLVLKATTGNASSSSYIDFVTGNNGALRAMRILNNGKVGVGTDNPLSQFSVVKNDGTFDMAVRIDDDKADGYTGIMLSGTGRTYNLLVGNHQEATFSLANKFAIWDNNAAASRFEINSSGVVRIPNLAGTGTRLVLTNASGDLAPISNGSNGQVLKMVGGNVAWANESGSSPGGSNTQLQFNSSGSFGGTTGLTWNNTNTELTLIKNDLGSTPSPGFVLQNTTAATDGTQQFSPAIRLTGQGWGTTAGSSQPLDFEIYNEGVRSTVPLGRLTFRARVNEGSWFNAAQLRSDGAFSAVSFTASGNVNGQSLIASAAGTILWSGRSRLVSPADGVVVLQNSTSTDFTRLNFGGTSSSFPALKKSGSTLQVRLGDDSDYSNLEVKDEAYGSSWNGSNEVPTKNAIYDKIESLSGGSGSPGGSGTEMQYRSGASTFGGAAGTSWDNTNRLFTLEKALDATQSLSGGWLLKNPTSATSGNQKISPPLWLEGNGFETTGSTSQSVRLGFDVLPVQGTTTYGTLRLLQSINGGTISVPLTFATQTNILTLAGSSTVGRLNLTSDGSSYVQRTGNLFHIIGHNGISSRSGGTMTVYSGTTTVDPVDYSNAFFNVIRTTLPQIAAVYDASNYTTFGTSSGGILTIAPSGGLSNFTGRLRVSALDTDGSAPTTSGTTKMVITDGNGELSFADIPGSGDSKVLPDANYTIVSTDAVLILPDPTTTRTLTLPAASTMPNKEITIFCKASSVGKWILAGSFVQHGLNMTEDHINSGLGSNQILRLRSCNHGGTWRWYDLNP